MHCDLFSMSMRMETELSTFVHGSVARGDAVGTTSHGAHVVHPGAIVSLTQLLIIFREEYFQARAFNIQYACITDEGKLIDHAEKAS